jgi:ketosteroid isomerase-like protein
MHAKAGSLPAACGLRARPSTITLVNPQGTIMKPRITVFISLVSLATQVFAEGAAEFRAQTRASLFRADDRLSQAMIYAGPVNGLVRFSAGDITYLHPDADIIVGRGNTLAFLRGIYAGFHADARTELHRMAGDISADGTLGYTFGWLDELKTPEDSTVVELSHGRYVAVWRRRDRDWELEAFLRLSSTAPPPPPPADALILDGEPGERVRDHAEAHALTASIADARFADHSLARGYSQAFDAHAAEAAIFLSAGNIYWNRAGVNQAFAGWTPDQSLRWHPLRAAAAASGDLAWTVGHGNFWFGLGTGAESAAPSKYLTLWLRTPQGWRFLLDAGSSRPADPLPR